MKNRDAYKMYPPGLPVEERRARALAHYAGRYGGTMRVLAFCRNPRPGGPRWSFIGTVRIMTNFNIWNGSCCVTGVNSAVKARRLLPEIQRRGWSMRPIPLPKYEG